MTEHIDTVKNAVLDEIKKKMRLLIFVVTFVIVTLFGVILGHLYDPMISVL